MKSYNHIFEKLIEEDNIKLAIHNSSLGKRDRKEVAEVMKDEDRHVKETIRLLTTQTFVVPDHKLIEINDGITAKKRIIIQPRYCYEQIIHHATVQVLKPIFMKGMYPYTCGSIPGRGAHYGKKYIEKFIRENPRDIKYCYKMDIHHFFQSISHSKLKAKFRETIHDPKMIWLLDLIVDGYVDHYEEGEAYGIPIGYYTSQWFANWYLQNLDHYIKEDLGVKCYVRYTDDIILFGRNKKELHKIKEKIGAYLSDRLDLEIKSNWQVFRFDYISRANGERKGRFLDFMGFRFYRDRTTLRRSIMLKATRKAKRISKKDKISWYDSAQMISYLGWFKSANMYKCYEKYIKENVNVRDLKHKVSVKGKEDKSHVLKLQDGGGISGDKT